MDAAARMYFRRLPAGLRDSLRRGHWRIGLSGGNKTDHVAYVWEMICGCGSAKLVLWYHEHTENLGFRWPNHSRRLDRLFEWDSTKLIERIFATGNNRLIRDLASAALRNIDRDTVIRAVILFDHRKFEAHRSTWGIYMIEEAIDSQLWSVAASLLSKGYHATGQFVQILRDDPERFTKYRQLIADHYMGNNDNDIEFPED